MGDYSRRFASESDARAWANSYKGETVKVHVDPPRLRPLRAAERRPLGGCLSRRVPPVPGPPRTGFRPWGGDPLSTAAEGPGSDSTPSQIKSRVPVVSSLRPGKEPSPLELFIPSAPRAICRKLPRFPLRLNQIQSKEPKRRAGDSPPFNSTGHLRGARAQRRRKYRQLSIIIGNISDDSFSGRFRCGAVACCSSAGTKVRGAWPEIGERWPRKRLYRTTKRSQTKT